MLDTRYIYEMIYSAYSHTIWIVILQLHYCICIFNWYIKLGGILWIRFLNIILECLELIFFHFIKSPVFPSEKNHEAYLDCGIRCEMSTYRVDGHLNAASKRHINLKMSLSNSCDTRCFMMESWWFRMIQNWLWFQDDSWFKQISAVSRWQQSLLDFVAALRSGETCVSSSKDSSLYADSDLGVAKQALEVPKGDKWNLRLCWR